MPGIESKARELKAKFYRGAPKANQPKIEEVINIYKTVSYTHLTLPTNREV